MHILIYTPVLTARIEYAWSVLLKYVLQVDFSFTSEVEIYIQTNACKINYSKERLLEQEVSLPIGNLLIESGIRPQNISVFQHDGLPAFFRVESAAADLPFDLPALVFYLVTRYEEYLSFESDTHGRFTAKQSLAYRENFLRQPLVNEWAICLRQLLQHKNPNFHFPVLKYEFQPTYDLDMAWAYLHKGWKRTAGGYLKTILKGDFTALKQRWQVQFSKKEDPFFTFPYLDALHNRFQLKPIYFVLLGDYNKFDTNISPSNWAFLWILQQLQKRYRLGIHPSYHSNKKQAQLQKEISRLRAIKQEPVVFSRQHFLKLTFPDTYRHLLQVGIAVDYSLGYADDIGFRASIATPYPWYDLTQETMNPLLLYPFQVMDVTLKKYLQLNTIQAIENVQLIIQKTKAVGGTFCTLWHNSSFSYIDDWNGWDEVYEAILKMATQEPM